MLGLSPVLVLGFPTAVASPVVDRGLQGVQDSAVAAPRLQGTGSVVVGRGLRCSVPCGIPVDRDQTCAPCLGRGVLCHGATREALPFRFIILRFLSDS